MDHSAAPLLDALVDYHARDRYGFTPPGHRQGRGADPRTRAALGQDAFRSDVLATAGLDDRTSSHGYLSRAEELMADAVGAEQAFFSTCGSSLSVKAAMLAVAGGQGDLLISRDAHKSVVAGLVFSGVQPQWIQPRYDTRLHLAHPPSPEQVEQAWQEHPDAAGALIVSPTPYGTCADIFSIASLCHRRGKPLIVDEAWGAHLPFHPDLPTWAMDAGADVCVVSVHKMGTGFEQGSVFHRQGDLVDPDQLSACADMLMTTSPNVMVYAALDGWRRQMVQHGHHLLDAVLTLAGQVRQDIDALPGLHVLREEFLGAEASHDLDPLHVVIDVSDLGVTGYDAADWLRENHRLDMGLSDHRRMEATLSLADDAQTAARLMSALTDLTKQAGTLPPARQVELPSAAELELEPAMLPRDAFFAPKETVPASHAAGRICAEQITPYPPGIPVIIPGERITVELLDYLRSGVSAGMQLPDAADPALDTIRVVSRH
jgi:arginine/lysine/ornithine decarboxylase